jgi:predicted transcriptional regulator
MMIRALKIGPIAIALLAPVLASGCVAHAAYSVATAPVRVASKTVDLATTSQGEADRNRGRAVRHRDDKLADLQRSYDKHMRRCSSNDENACSEARDELADIQELHMAR